MNQGCEGHGGTAACVNAKRVSPIARTSFRICGQRCDLGKSGLTRTVSGMRGLGHPSPIGIRNITRVGTRNDTRVGTRNDGVPFRLRLRVGRFRYPEVVVPTIHMRTECDNKFDVVQSFSDDS